MSICVSSLMFFPTRTLLTLCHSSMISSHHPRYIDLLSIHYEAVPISGPYLSYSISHRMILKTIIFYPTPSIIII